MAIWQNWCFGQFEGWKKVEIGLFLLASYAPRNLATDTRVIPMGLKYAQKPWEGSELPLASEMGHSFYGKPGYTNYATFITLCLICALNSIIGNAILCPVPCKKAGLGLGWLFSVFHKSKVEHSLFSVRKLRMARVWQCFTNSNSETAFRLKSLSYSSPVKHCQHKIKKELAWLSQQQHQ